ncbi:hypothetical protein AWC02_00035 [Mycolicibacter engbaekii]|uniref:HTH cro/C1-type domain-containing protein n=1 Tax=Mycolicibacter engbaekii TaxID=188915 RepID=A0A1X1UD22_9MYCO|nr:helix-turn-helix transcriptional regulator [Mycolicibacter engbaekii]ORV54691.1 hypothetical protein AWC02_00035 [Mycolicibacter engbaekii]
MTAGDRAAEYFGRALAAARAEKGLKRMQLKDLSGLSYPYISEIENGGKYPSQRAIQSLAAALEISPSELIARAEQIETNAAGDEPSNSSYPVLSSSPDQAFAPLRPTGTRPIAQGENDVISRLTEQVLQAVEPRLREWLHTEIRMAVADELHSQKGIDDNPHH